MKRSSLPIEQRLPKRLSQLRIFTAGHLSLASLYQSISPKEFTRAQHRSLARWVAKWYRDADEEIINIYGWYLYLWRDGLTEGTMIRRHNAKASTAELAMLKTLERVNKVDISSKGGCESIKKKGWCLRQRKEWLTIVTWLFMINHHVLT